MDHKYFDGFTEVTKEQIDRETMELRRLTVQEQLDQIRFDVASLKESRKLEERKSINDPIESRQELEAMLAEHKQTILLLCAQVDELIERVK